MYFFVVFVVVIVDVIALLTFRYAPEVGARKFGPKADMYSFGLVMWTMVCFQSLFASFSFVNT